jgi:hypothetical protein
MGGTNPTARVVQEREVIAGLSCFEWKTKDSLGSPGACAAPGLMGQAGTWTAAVKGHWRQSSASCNLVSSSGGHSWPRLPPRERGHPPKRTPAAVRGHRQKPLCGGRGDRAMAPPCGSARQRRSAGNFSCFLELSWTGEKDSGKGRFSDNMADRGSLQLEKREANAHIVKHPL